MNTDNTAQGLGPDLAAEAPAPSNGQAPAAEAPCDECEDGLTIGRPLTRSSERALGLFGIVMGGIIVLMGIDLFTGGRLAQLVGAGRGAGDAESSA